MSQSFHVSACIWANLWVLQSPQPENGPSFLPLGWRWWWAYLLLHHHPSFWFHSHFQDRYIPPYSLLCCDRESRGGVFVECVNVSAWLCPRFIPGFFQLVFSRRHCCRSSWRWREVEVPGVRCCCPGLFEYGASGRGRWTIAARPHGPLYDRPGNVEWRPGTGKREKKMTITNVKSKFGLKVFRPRVISHSWPLKLYESIK